MKLDDLNKKVYLFKLLIKTDFLQNTYQLIINK